MASTTHVHQDDGICLLFLSNVLSTNEMALVGYDMHPSHGTDTHP